MKLQIFNNVLAVAFFVSVAVGHGMLMDPVNRASRWRIDGSNPKDYTDHEGFCGGAKYQYYEVDGRCGLCGDPYGMSTPRPHELGGMYGSTIVKSYDKGSIIPVRVKLTANHLGYFVFKICNLDDGEESDACFNRNLVKTKRGKNYKPASYRTGNFSFFLKLPQELTCNHCVLQWTYKAANNWGICKNGKRALGCEPQETFRTCSDIRIN